MNIQAMEHGIRTLGIENISCLYPLRSNCGNSIY